MTTLRAYRFFFEHAGYVVGHRAEGALQLARAEAFADDNGWVASWEWDDCPDLSWMSEAERAEPHEVLCCLLRDADGNVLASLCGIVDPDNAYRRVVVAELSLEAMTNAVELSRVCAE